MAIVLIGRPFGLLIFIGLSSFHLDAGDLVYRLPSHQRVGTFSAINLVSCTRWPAVEVNLLNCVFEGRGAVVAACMTAGVGLPSPVTVMLN